MYSVNATERKRYNGLTPYQKTIVWHEKEIERYERQKLKHQSWVDADKSKKQRHWTISRRAHMFSLCATGGQLTALKRSLHFLKTHPPIDDSFKHGNNNCSG